MLKKTEVTYMVYIETNGEVMCQGRYSKRGAALRATSSFKYAGFDAWFERV